MDVMGEALAISRVQMLRLAEEAEVPLEIAGRIIDGICNVASQFSTIAENLCPGGITPDTLHTIQGRIEQSVARLHHGDAGGSRRRR
jgi:serine/threonine-protein kinase HipA